MSPNPCLDDVYHLLIHSDVIIATKCNIMNHLKRPRVLDHELLLSTCPKQVQNEHMGEETEYVAQPMLR